MHLKNTYSDIVDLNIKNLLSPWLQHVGYMQDTVSMLQFRKNLLNTKIIFDLYILCAFILLQFNKITFQLLNICVWNFKLFIDYMNFWLIDWLYIYFIWLYVYIHNLSLSLVLTSINRFVIIITINITINRFVAKFATRLNLNTTKTSVIKRKNLVCLLILRNSLLVGGHRHAKTLA